MKNIKYKQGDILLVKTFAGVNVHSKVVKIVDETSTYSGMGKINVKGFFGHLTRKQDLISLKKSCVPYTGKEALADTSSFTYDFQILKVIKKSK